MRQELFESPNRFARRVVKGLVCPIHGKRAHICTIETDPHGVICYPYVTRCCCQQFAKTIIDALNETGAFGGVNLEYENGFSIFVAEGESLTIT